MTETGAKDTSSHVLIETNAGVRTITLNRPEKKNAFTIAMYAQCVAALQEAATDNAVRVVLFTGNGSSFTAGNDLFDFMNNPPTGEDSPVMQFLYTIIDYEKPVVVAVEGNAVGIGVTMLLHCDLVYASETARFTTPFVSLGLVPEGASSWLLPRIAGHAKAAELLLLAEPMDAKTASDIGLVTRVIAPAELLAFARAKAQRLAELPPGSVREAKRLMRAPLREKIKQVVAEEAVQFAMKLGSPEAMEAFQAFFEKRKPDFSKLT